MTTKTALFFNLTNQCLTDIPEVTTYTTKVNNINITNSKFFTTPGTVQNIINKLPMKKSSSLDQVTNTALKYLPLNLIMSLTKIINGYLRISYFSSSWKKATMISIPKTGKNHKLPENLRSIALLSSLFLRKSSSSPLKIIYTAKFITSNLLPETATLLLSNQSTKSTKLVITQMMI